MKEKCCENCHYINCLGTYNIGLCSKYGHLTCRDKACNSFVPNFGGWIEITPDNLEDVFKLPTDRLMIAVIRGRKSFYVKYSEMLCLLSEMANLGGYYYYVLPELKIDKP